MTEREALKLALEALETVRHKIDSYQVNVCDDVDKAITSLRQAIAEAEKQEPVAWVDLLKAAEQIVKDKFLYKRFIDGTPLVNDIPCWMADFAQQYTHPQPQREWVGLTDEEVEKMRHLIDWTAHWSYGTFARAIEAKLKEKNT